MGVALGCGISRLRRDMSFEEETGMWLLCNFLILVELGTGKSQYRCWRRVEVNLSPQFFHCQYF